MALNEKQKVFAKEYIVDLNATQSAIRAGYKESTAYSQGQRLLKHVEVQKAIQEEMEKKDAERIARQDEVLEFLTSVMRGQKTEQVPIVTKEHWEMADKEPAIKDRTKAAELLGKRYALWNDNVNLSGEVGVKIVDDIPQGEDNGN